MEEEALLSDVEEETSGEEPVTSNVCPREEEEGDCCPICQMEMGDQEEELQDENAKTFRLTPCGHTFHTSCIVDWLRRGNTSCPTCRNDPHRRQRSFVSREEEEELSEEMYLSRQEVKSLHSHHSRLTSNYFRRKECPPELLAQKKRFDSVIKKRVEKRKKANEEWNDFKQEGRSEIFARGKRLERNRRRAGWGVRCLQRRLDRYRINKGVGMDTDFRFLTDAEVEEWNSNGTLPSPPLPGRRRPPNQTPDPVPVPGLSIPGTIFDLSTLIRNDVVLSSTPVYHPKLARPVHFASLEHFLDVWYEETPFPSAAVRRGGIRRRLMV